MNNENTSPNAIGRPRGSSGEITAPRILNIAMQVFSKHGYKASSMKEIAKAAGLTVGSIYHYYPSKAELFVASATMLYDVCRRIFAKLLEEESSFSARLTGLLQEGEKFFCAEEDLQRFAMGLPTELRHHKDLREALAPQYNVFADLYKQLAQDAHDNNELPAGITPETVAIMLEVLMSTAYPQMARAAGDNFEDVIKQLNEILLKGFSK